ncbi:hypothetical protein JA1_002429 [Spathaspora sp. JA1]|nr:hypothetical protein JA1_002429 [Spathaspora sp. JA1]
MSSPLIQLHPVVLFNVSDIISRSKDSVAGILLGHGEGEHLIISSSFEILHDNGGVVDFEYLYKRFNQFKTVFPQCKLLGIYHILSETDNKGESYDSLSGNWFTILILQQIEQFISGYEIPTEGSLFYTIFNSQHLKHSYQQGTPSFKSYSYDNSQPLKTIISTTDTETIATSTIQKNKKYFTNSHTKEDNIPHNISVANHTAELRTSLTQLQQRIAKILKYLENDQGIIPETNEARQEKIQIENLIVHLSNKLNSFKQTTTTSDETTILTKLQTSNLALITEQLTILEKQKVFAKKSILNNELNHQGARYLS